MVRFLTNECGLEDTKTGETITLIEYDEDGNETINHDGIRKIQQIMNYMDFDLEFLMQVIETFKQKIIQKKQKHLYMIKDI